jgi:pilus assembly protein Flp/PilA
LNLPELKLDGYGLIAAGIAVAIIPVITGLGTHLKTTFSTISSALK